MDTGDIPSSATNTYIAEAAAVRGAFSLQSEYAFTGVRATDAQNPAFHAFYVFGSYFLTGESRRYRSRNASFGEIRPKVPFAGIHELGGALEIAFRYSRLDLEDKSCRRWCLERFDRCLQLVCEPQRETAAQRDPSQAARAGPVLDLADTNAVRLLTLG